MNFHKKGNLCILLNACGVHDDLINVYSLYTEVSVLERLRPKSDVSQRMYIFVYALIGYVLHLQSHIFKIQIHLVNSESAATDICC